jgi:CDP-glucose 4,6-dehydratase
LGKWQGALENMGLTPAFWTGRRVLLTGHTGFKGAWTARWLHRLGAAVTGLSLAPDSDPNLFSLLEPTTRIRSCLVDIRDAPALRAVVEACDPEIVLHLAGQALVPRGYREPIETWATNVIGTATLLDALRDRPSVKAVVVVTSDKVYAGDVPGRGFVETDRLGGDDPYSASKAAAELVATAWRSSFFRAGAPIVTARAGNVIGGGDWSADRLVPDFVRAIAAGRPLELRHPEATRPWQHVLDPVAGYLLLAERLATGTALPPAVNFGPPGDAVCTTRDLVERLFAAFGRAPDWRRAVRPDIPEKSNLALDAALAYRTIEWRPRLGIDAAIAWSVEWYAAHAAGADIAALTDAQIARYEVPP